MTRELFSKILQHNAVMIIMKKLLQAGLITEEEYYAIDTKSADEIGIPYRSIYRRNDLIYNGTRVNMSPNKGGSVDYEDDDRTQNTATTAN